MNKKSDYKNELKIFLNEIKKFNKEKNKPLKIKKNSKIKNLALKNLKKILKEENYFIINLKTKIDKEIRELTDITANALGSKISQNKKGEKTITVTPNVKLIKNYGSRINNEIRYHQSNLGGSLHTDGPQLNQTPNILIMTCLNNSSKGGDSVLINGKDIYNYIKKDNPKILKNLFKKFYFERRGFTLNSNYIFKSQIFKFKKRKLEFRYLREYIDNAYKQKNTTPSKIEKKALDYLDKCLRLKSLQKKYKLSKGEMVVINNKIMAHGRTTFSVNKGNQRKIIRIWLK